MKRRAFNSERWKLFCRDCNRIPSSPFNPSSNSHSAKLNKALRGLAIIRDRLKEEARVMENCFFKANTAASRKECPLFNPSDYQLQGYPHHTPLFSKKPVNNNSLWYLQGLRASENHFRTRRKESPLFNPSDYLHHGYPHHRTRSYQKPGVW